MQNYFRKSRRLGFSPGMQRPPKISSLTVMKIDWGVLKNARARLTVYECEFEWNEE